MDTKVSSSDSEIIAQVQLLKAYMQKKNTLIYELNKIKIRNSYRQSNSISRDLRNISSTSKILYKKFLELRAVNTELKSMTSKVLPNETVKKLIGNILDSNENMIHVDSIFNKTNEIDLNIQKLDNKYKNLKNIIESKKEKIDRNEKLINEISQKEKIIEELSDQVVSLKNVMNFYNRKIDESKKNIFLVSNRRSSEDRQKFYNLKINDDFYKEKELLIEENNKLKRRISGLNSPSRY